MTHPPQQPERAERWGQETTQGDSRIWIGGAVGAAHRETHPLQVGMGGEAGFSGCNGKMEGIGFYICCPHRSSYPGVQGGRVTIATPATPVGTPLTHLLVFVPIIFQN